MTGFVEDCLLALTAPSINVIVMWIHNPGADVGQKGCESVMSYLSEATKSTSHHQK